MYFMALKPLLQWIKYNFGTTLLESGFDLCKIDTRSILFVLRELLFFIFNMMSIEIRPLAFKHLALPQVGQFISTNLLFLKHTFNFYFQIMTNFYLYHHILLCLSINILQVHKITIYLLNLLVVCYLTKKIDQ